MAEPKTKVNTASVDQFIGKIKDEATRDDCHQLVSIMEEITGEQAKMWGASIIGFGSWRYQYSNGKEADWPLCAFSPRKQNLTIYFSSEGFGDYKDLLSKLGKHKTSKACLYIKSLNDVHIPTLKKMLQKSFRAAKKKYTSAGN